MKVAYGKFGPRYDYRGAHVTLDYPERGKLLGEVIGQYYFREGSFAGYRFKVRHMNGEPWPIDPCCASVEVLERTYPEPCQWCGENDCDERCYIEDVIV